MSSIQVLPVESRSPLMARVSGEAFYTALTAMRYRQGTKVREKWNAGTFPPQPSRP
jgi:hypothetical protein